MQDAPRFSKDTLSFILKASRQSHPQWLDRNRDDYERLLLEPLQNLAKSLKEALGAQATGYHFPQKGIGRLKRPANRVGEGGGTYKSWIAYSASRPAQSRFEHNPNLFFLLQPEDTEGDQVLVAGGLYMPSSQQLRAVRQAIAEDATPFDRLFASKKFSAHFKGGFSDERTSTRPPRGFDPSHKRINWLKLKAFFVWKSYSIRDFSSAAFPTQVAKDWTQLLRLNELLDQAIQKKLSSQKKLPEKGDSLLSLLDRIEAPIRQMDF